MRSAVVLSITALTCMWIATILLMLMFFCRNMDWVEEVNVLAYSGYVAVVGLFGVTVKNSG